MKRLKTITSYAGCARFWAECSSGTRWMARKHCPVRTPFSSGPSVAIVEWQGKQVWLAETSHKRYEVWEVGAALVRNTESEANEEQLKPTAV